MEPRRTVRVGCAQYPPRFFDREATLVRAESILAEAGRLGLDLVVFPETWFAAYPYWRGSVSVRRSTELAARMQQSALRIPGPEAQALAEAARRANVAVVMGCNELSDLPGSRTLYNTLLFISRDGRILGRHRKLMPTHSERVYWGMGDGRDVVTFSMDIGRVGGLICYEHHMTLLKAAMAMLGEEIHCAVWPGWWSMEKHLGGKKRQAGSLDCDILPAVREYAIETQTFVVSCSWYLPASEIPDDLKDEMRYNLAAGGSCIVNPAGLFVREPVFEQEGLVWADIDLYERDLVKAYFDAVGHYSRWDVLRLQLNREPTEPAWVREERTGRERHRAAGPPPLSSSRVRELSERFEIPEERVQALVHALGEDPAASA